MVDIYLGKKFYFILKGIKIVEKLIKGYESFYYSLNMNNNWNVFELIFGNV